MTANSGWVRGLALKSGRSGAVGGETRLGVHLGPQEYEGPAGQQVKVE